MKQSIKVFLGVTFLSLFVFGCRNNKKTSPSPTVEPTVTQSIVPTEPSEIPTVEPTSTPSGKEKHEGGLIYTLHEDNTYSVAWDRETDLTEVIVPSTFADYPVTSIENDGFSFSKIERISISRNIVSIGNNAFESCSSLINIDVDENNKIFSSYEGVLFDKNQKTLLICPGGRSGNYSVPNTVTSIAIRAFYNCSLLTSINLFDGLISIGDYAFYKCAGITSISIPSTVDLISSSAFNDCYSLSSFYVEEENLFYTVLDEMLVYTSYYLRSIVRCPLTLAGNIIINDSMTTVDDFAFQGCSHISSIITPNSITTIGDNAFSDCSSLKTIYIGKSVESIGKNAFRDSPLFSIEVDEENEIYSSDNGVLFDKNQTTLITCPEGYRFEEYTIPNSVYTICDSAFYNCFAIASISIPDSVVSIGNSAFNGCSSLKSIVIPDKVTSINDRSFRRCRSLESIIIGNSVESIGKLAFSSCESLTAIRIPNSVVSIGEKAFIYCKSLTYVYIPTSVLYIEEYAFYTCYSLKVIYCEAESKPEGWNEKWKPNRIEAVWGYHE